MQNPDIGIAGYITEREDCSVIGYYVGPTTYADFTYIGKPKAGHIHLNIKLKTYLKDLTTLILYATFSDTTEIDQARIVALQE